MFRLYLLLLGLVLVGCTSDSPQLTCAAGTIEIDGSCVPICETGTHPDGDSCAPDLVCGAGTHLEGDSCVANVECGAGTHEENGECLPGVVCGTGTHVENGMCLPDVIPPNGGYQIRVLTDQVEADGHTAFQVMAIGTNPDGTPSTVQVVFNTDRPGAGTFSPPAPQLTAFGATTSFTPCSFTTPGCIGPVTLTLALASDPSAIVAHVDVDLVTPPPVYTAAPCLTGGDVMYFDGNDFIYNGMLTVTQGTFQGASSPNVIAIQVQPSSGGTPWYLSFDSTHLGVPLDAGVYENAQRESFSMPGHPGLEVYGNGHGCNTITGRFQVHEHVRDANGLVSATVSFEQHCEGGAPVLNGCIHYER